MVEDEHVATEDGPKPKEEPAHDYDHRVSIESESPANVAIQAIEVPQAATSPPHNSIIGAETPSVLDKPLASLDVYNATPISPVPDTVNVPMLVVTLPEEPLQDPSVESAPVAEVSPMPLFKRESFPGSQSMMKQAPRKEAEEISKSATPDIARELVFSPSPALETPVDETLDAHPKKRRKRRVKRDQHIQDERFPSSPPMWPQIQQPEPFRDRVQIAPFQIAAPGEQLAPELSFPIC
jgi:hypothetical protein